MGRLLIIIGAGLVLIGIIIQYVPDAFKWFGQLPGDFKSTEGKIKIYFPLTSMLLISLLINLLVRAYKYFL